MISNPGEKNIEHSSAGIFKLQNTIKNYDWGSPEWIPALLGQKNPGRVPWAELWMGVNAMGPSVAILPMKNEPLPSVPDASVPGNQAQLLSELIALNSEAMLGKACAGKYGNLPFLFKVIAVAKPLSIQAHPGSSHAREGFERENREGLPIDAPNRNYRDSGRKPELICALSPFAALCGFRTVQEICSLIGIILQASDGALRASLESLLSALKTEEENSREISMRAFISAFLSMDGGDLGAFMIKRQSLLERDFPTYQGEWKLCAYLASLYPKESGVIAPLFLNIIELKPGEAMYIPTGTLHSYIHGMGIELMADSDNVIRAGLTAKHVDRDELLEILDFTEYMPEILKAIDNPAAPYMFSYPGQYEEFTLSVLKSNGNEVSYSETGPSVILVTEGNAVIEPEALEMKTGESAFIPAGKKLVFSGNFKAYAAAVNE